MPKSEVGIANGSPFSPDAPCLGCCNDFKGATKAAAPLYLSFTATAAAIQQTAHVTAATMSGVISIKQNHSAELWFRIVLHTLGQNDHAMAPAASCRVYRGGCLGMGDHRL